MEEEILKICEENVVDKETEKHLTIESEISKENGLDSLALMNIIINLESQYDIDLDDYIVEISKARTVGDIIKCVCGIIRDTTENM